MFHIRGIDGFSRSYAVGEVRARRKPEAVAAAGRTEAVTTEPSPEQPPAAGSRRPLQGYHDRGSGEPTRKELRLAGEIMTSPVFTVTPNTSIKELQQIFSERRFRHLPVLSTEGRLVGLVSDRDVLRFQMKLFEEALSPALMPASRLMTTDVLTATADTAIRDIARTMFEERIGAMPIVGESDALEGMITRSDILRAMITHGPVKLWA